jgi:hypothetical protein
VAEKSLPFLLGIGAIPPRQILKFDLVSVKLRPLDTGEPRDASHGDSAAATHADAIDHDGIQTRDGGDLPAARDLSGSLMMRTGPTK